jgi:DEAD/DEAH box helicase domain-containing protein
MVREREGGAVRIFGEDGREVKMEVLSDEE